MIKAVIFDMDGVLIDTEKYYTKYWKEAARYSGFPFETEHGLFLRSFSGKYAQMFMTMIFGERFDMNTVRDRRKALMEPKLLADGIMKKPGVDTLLAALHERNIRTAVATASDWRRAKKYLEMIGILDQFDEIICVDMIENGKPMPDIYRYACEKLNLPPKYCIAVEDSPNGILSAYQAGCKAVMVPDLTGPDDILKLMLYACVPALDDITALVDRENEGCTTLPFSI